MKIFLIILLILVILWVLIGVGFFIFSCVRFTKKRDCLGADTPAWKGFEEHLKPYQKWVRDNATEKIHLKSFDGLDLTGILIETENARGTIVVMHGYRSFSNVDFAPEAEFFTKCGFNVIMPCQRSHDESDGKIITFGSKERFDCKMWLEYAEKRYGNDKDIFLAGISMGCATVLMTAGLELPSNVRGIVADCGFTTAWDIMKEVASAFPLPNFIITPILATTNLVSCIVCGFNFKEVSTIDAMKTNKLPILFIHGDNDDFVPEYMTHQNYEACIAEKRLLIVNGAPHAASYLTDLEGCQKELSDFFETYRKS